MSAELSLPIAPLADEVITVPSLDLKAQYRSIRTEVEAAIRRVMESQQFILGPEVEAFEQELAQYVGSTHSVGVASGSDALLISLMALDVRPGDEVVTTPYTFFATAGAIARLCAKPVFVDIEPHSYNLDPRPLADYLHGKHAVLNDRGRFDHDPRRVKAILPVHLFGQAADMHSICDLANRFGVPVIEDAAQALGALHHRRPVGTMGRLGCFSFFPSKNLGAAGDGGAVVTGDATLAAKLRLLRTHGAKPKYLHQIIGLNSRLDALQAAILRVKLPHLDEWTESRRAAAERYDELLAPWHDGERLVLPWQRDGDRHIFNQYVVRTPRRDAVMDALKATRIGCEIYYPQPMHLQECFRNLGYRAGDLPISEAAARQTLALPMYPEITPAQQEHVCRMVGRAVGA